MLLKSQQLNEISHLQHALDQWKAAELYFQTVSDPDLVEYAAFDLEAARRRYVYL